MLRKAKSKHNIQSYKGVGDISSSFIFSARQTGQRQSLLSVGVIFGNSLHQQFCSGELAPHSKAALHLVQNFCIS